MKEGVERRLADKDYDSLPESRHIYRGQGLRAIRRAESDLNAGEFLMSISIIILGTYASISSSFIDVRAFSGYFSTITLTYISIATAVFGLLVLGFVMIRNVALRQMTFDNHDLSVGRSNELLVKAHWNKQAAKKPGRVIQAYYTLYLAKMIDDRVYCATLSVFAKLMDEKGSERQVWRDLIRVILESFDNPSDEV